MAIYYRMTCRECGGVVINHEQSKRYVHAGMAPEREPHRPVIVTTKSGERAA